MKRESQKFLPDHLAGSLREARRNYGRRLKRCRKKFSEKAVHDLRVETRRLLALLDFQQAAHFGDATGRTRKILKQRLDAFDELRDTQVHLQLLKPLWPEFPEAKPLRKLLKRHEQRLIKQTRKKVLGTRQGHLRRKLKKLEQQIRGASTSKPKQDDQRIAIKTLRDSFDRMVSLRHRIRGEDPAAIHKLRVAFKRFRYMSELLQPFLPWLTRERIRRMRKFQGSAGDIQDLDILLAKLAQFVQEKEVPAAMLEKLRGALSRRKEHALDFFMKRIDDLLEFQPESPAPKTHGTT
jgi:CHAD domain-containing protein